MMTLVKFQLKSAGYCEASQSHALRGTPNKTIKFYATYGIIEHPTKGYILFDSGYTTRFYEATKKFPFSIYAKLTKVYIEKESEVIYAIEQMGIQASDISYIIVSHFHADHIGGLKDFPNAKFICSKEAYDDIAYKKGIAALQKGFIPSLLPSDFKLRVTFADFNNTEEDYLGKTADVFNDGSILLCKLSGHAKGQIGAILNTIEKKVFLVADAAWLKPNYQKFHLPTPLIRIFIDSWKDYTKSLRKVYNYHKANPKVLIIPCHCEETLKDLTS